MPQQHIQRHAIFMKRKLAAMIAFTTALFLFCVENVKAFTAPLSSPDTLVMLATGLHSVAKQNELWKKTTVKLSPALRKTSPTSSTSLKAFGFGAPVEQKRSSPQMLDMKTSINAFNGWYNQMDPVARPPVYDDEATDYSFSFSSPADSWPSSFVDDAVTTSSTPANTLLASERKQQSKRPRPIRTIRKIAGWFLDTPVARNARGFGTQTYL
ncbi:hypothetical protein CTEN210_18088 [Chaetoceros tenuissimus]|uniref:Uncharacterized protein n=1 Tax=Chaetoceros tenuissimus TaxID=426638 RepID=A0AAD3DCT6_9STRA|nr:hypothetical protein CTEN210_18088 [Chaetoceros tenuissimus]